MLKLLPKKQYPKHETGINEMGLVYAEIELTNGGDILVSSRAN